MSPSRGMVRSDFWGGSIWAGPLRLDPSISTFLALVEIKGALRRSRRCAGVCRAVVDGCKLSNAVGGWKALLLKPFDPLFRKDGRTFIPITISGARARPSFGLDRQRLFDRGQTDRRAEVNVVYCWRDSRCRVLTWTSGWAPAAAAVALMPLSLLRPVRLRRRVGARHLRQLGVVDAAHGDRAQ